MDKTKNIEPPRGFGVIAYRQAKVEVQHLTIKHKYTITNIGENVIVGVHTVRPLGGVGLPPPPAIYGAKQCPM